MTSRFWTSSALNLLLAQFEAEANDPYGRVRPDSLHSEKVGAHRVPACLRYRLFRVSRSRRDVRGIEPRKLL
jgi:hypothetical protein